MALTIGPGITIGAGITMVPFGVPNPLVLTAGTGTYVVQPGATTLVIEAWGGGGGSMGQDNTNGAGAGGAYAKTTLSVTPGQIIYYSVGPGGIGSQTGGTTGTASWANLGTYTPPATASSGALAAGGAGAPVVAPNTSMQFISSIGQVIWWGGAGGTGAEGGGGGAAGPNGPGISGSVGNGGAGGAGNAGFGGAGGAAGGTTLNGGDGQSNENGGGGGGGAYNNRGGNGGSPGGAGGAGFGTTDTVNPSGANTNAHGYGGDGGRGQIRITWS